MNEKAIQDYLCGSLSGNEKRDFEDRMKNDTSFATEVEEHKNMLIAIQALERVELKKRFEKLEKKNRKKSWYGKFAVAASIAVIVGVGSFFFLGKPSGQTLYAENFEAYPNVIAPITRGRTITTDEDAPFVAYEKGEYKDAISGFKTQLKANEDATVRFYLAMALLNSGEKNRALNELNKLNRLETDFSAQILWYKSLIYIEKENYTEASLLLKDLAKTNTGYKRNEVKVLLEKTQN